jgi:Flp pilus assembly pilin Flp
MMTLEAMRAWLRSRNFGLSRKGQNTVEYLLMLTVVVGVVLVAGVALKRFMPGLFSQIQQMISGAAGSLGQGG